MSSSSPSFRDLHREAPGFSIYFITAVMARLTLEGLKLALILAAANTPNGLTLGGLLVAAFLVPSVVAAPFAGRIADMSDNPRRLYSLAFLFNGTMIVLCSLLLGHTHPAVILVLAAMGGSVGPLMQGGLSSLVGTIVPQSLMNQAYALDVVTYNVSQILAPALVAAIAGAISPNVALMFLAALVFFASASVLRLPLGDTTNRAIIIAPSPIDGIKAIAKVVPLRTTVVATSLSAVGSGILPVAATILAMNTFSVNAGIMLSTMAVGALIGSLSYAARPFGTDAPHRLVPFISMAIAVPIAIIAITPSTALALFLFACAGFLGGPQGTAQFTVRDRFSPPNVRTQVFTLSTSIKTTTAALGAAVAGIMSGAPVAVLLAIAVSANIVGGLSAIADLRAHGWMKPTDTADESLPEVEIPA